MRLNVYKLIYLLYYFRKTILERNFFVIIKEIKLKIARMGWISDIKLFNKFYYNKQWYKTIELGEEILKSQKDNKSFLRKFGVAYFKINRIEKARLYIAQSLCLTINKDISHIVEIVEKDLITDNPEIYSQYDYIGGTDNLGFVKHKCIKNNEGYKYLTKIAQTNYPMDHYWNKESFFYEEVQKKYPEFKNITPQIINTLKMEKEKLEYQISNCIAPAINHMKELVTDKEEIREKRKMK